MLPRSGFQKLLAAALSLAVLWLQPGSALAQPIELLSLTHLWRYNQSGADLGTAWREADYNDSDWPSGPGVLANEGENALVQSLTNTVLSRMGTNGQYNTVDYFRAHFTLTSPTPPGYMLIASNLVDDGAVVYLNGQELFRLGMPSGPITATTLASRTLGVGQEGFFEVTNLSTAGLIVGDNVLAVEVHQPYVTSSDVVWGLALLYAPQEPLALVSEPADATVPEGQLATLGITVSGSIPRVQWWKDDAPLADATNATVSIPATLRTDAGQYWAVVSNDLGAVTSRVATLTVVLDREPPVLTSATEVYPGSISVYFSEPIEPATAVDPAHYAITTPDGSLVAINGITLVSPTGVAFGALPLTAGMNHFLRVTGVQDPFGNTIAPDSGMAIVASATVTNLPLESAWRYNDTGIDAGAEWREVGYADGGWPQGAALLYNDQNLNLLPPGVARTLVAVTNASGSFWTHYFRARFTNTASPIDARLHLWYYLDDGAVFYLNGQELLRQGMPPGPVTHTTRATSSAQEGNYFPVQGLPATHLRVGDNVLAVEVHQFSLASPTLPDISFGAQLEVTAASFATVPPRILSEPKDIVVPEGTAAIFRAHTAAAAGVQWYRDRLPIPGANGPLFTNAPSRVEDTGARFELVASNSFGAVTSRVARLTVRPDLTAPRLLQARMGTNTDRVLLSFSEPLDRPSAELASHYTITNKLGASLLVVSASLTNGTNVILVTAPRSPGQRYVIAVDGLKDASNAANPISSNGRVGIGYEVLLLPYEWVWRYDESGTELGTDWRTPGFIDDAWPQGPGLLGFEDPLLLPVPLRTTLTPPEIRGPTYYFRTWLAFDGDPAAAVLHLRHIIDDGAVYYLNGQEVHRVGVPEGQSASTLANRNAPDGTIEGPFVISTGALVSGMNLLAAEVHQVTVSSADVVFGTELVQAYPADPPGPIGPSLRFSRSGSEIWLEWDAWQFTLECAQDLAGPWSPAPHPTLPYQVTADVPAKFYRLREGTR